MKGCDYLETTHTVCERRRSRIFFVRRLIWEAYQRTQAGAPGSQTDMFAPADMSTDARAEWQGIVDALASEEKRLDHQFWWRCPHEAAAA